MSTNPTAREIPAEEPAINPALTVPVDPLADALDTLADPTPTPGVRLGAAGIARHEVELLRDRDRLLRHYLGKIANVIGRRTRSTLREEGEIEHVGEGVLAELERRNTWDETTTAIAALWGRIDHKLGGSRAELSELARLLDALARAHDPQEQAALKMPAVLVARCKNYREDINAGCTGRIRFRWGQSQAACSTCGAYCGIAVAAWERVKTGGQDR